MRNPRTKSALVLGTATLAAVAARDYKAWYALGAGGVPHNPRGWLLTTGLRTLKREPLSPKVYQRSIGEPADRSGLADLPRREGDRPKVAPYPIPHRQLDQPGDPAARDRVRDGFDEAVHADTSVFWHLSGFEKHTNAVTVVPHLLTHATARQTHGELAHIHPGDGSMHMIFSPSDAATVLETGWGERHPLAGRLRLPLTYLLIYAPRTQQDADATLMLLNASLAYMTQQLEPGPA